MEDTQPHSGAHLRHKLIIVMAIILAFSCIFQLRIIKREFNLIIRQDRLIDKQNDLIKVNDSVLQETGQTLRQAGDAYANLINLHKQDQLKLQLMEEKLKRAYDGIDRLQCRLQYATDGHLHLCDIDGVGESK